ncbi:hypothetical protein VZT92_004646 [Zoarces viviparus]|uniref:Ty3 transposon capsid-like protein domain-containing protein n=1 Tax=Zoarces viviparus TaxID=48416 RepID=A0AAW1FYK3_ZOAVI
MVQGLSQPRPSPLDSTAGDVQLVRESPVPSPAPFHGDMRACRGFLLQTTFVFNQQPRTFASDSSRIAYLTGLLHGRALDWAQAWFTQNPLDTVSFGQYLEAFRRAFDHPTYSQGAVQNLLRLRQGSASAAEHSIDFRILAAESGWEERALKRFFLSSLSEGLKDELAVLEEARTLEDLIALTIRLDTRMQERWRERNYRLPAPVRRPVATSGHRSPVPPRRRSPGHQHSPAPAPSPEDRDEPMQLGRFHLSQDERERRIRSGACLYCGEPGHRIPVCPVRPKERARQ